MAEVLNPDNNNVGPIPEGSGGDVKLDPVIEQQAKVGAPPAEPVPPVAGPPTDQSKRGQPRREDRDQFAARQSTQKDFGEPELRRLVVPLPPDCGLQVDDFLLDDLVKALRRDTLTIFECVENRVLKAAPYGILQHSSFNGYRGMDQNATRHPVVAQHLLELSEPLLVILTATVPLLNSLSERNGTYDCDRIITHLQKTGIFVLVCTRPDRNLLNERRLRHHPHLRRRLVRGNDMHRWLPTILKERFGDKSPSLLTKIDTQRNADLWPKDDGDFHYEVTKLIDEDAFERELDRRSQNHSRGSGKLDPGMTPEAFLRDGSKALEHRTAFLRAFLSHPSPYLLEVSLRAITGAESEDWKRYSRERVDVLGVVSAFGTDRIRAAFEGDQGLYLRYAGEILDKLLPNSATPQVEDDCFKVICDGASLDPSGFGHDMFFRALRVDRRTGEKGWDDVVGEGDAKKAALDRAKRLLALLLSDSMTAPIAESALDDLLRWRRPLDLLDLFDGADLSSDLALDTYYRYVGRVFNEGASEAKVAARQKLWNRAFASPSDFIQVLFRLSLWLPDEDAGPSQAALMGIDVMTSLLERLLLRGWKDADTKSHPLMVRLATEGYREQFQSILFDWLFHPSVRKALDSLFLVHILLLVECWTIPADVLDTALRSDQAARDYRDACLQGLLAGMESSERGLRDQAPPLFAAMLLAEWAEAGGSLTGLARLPRKEIEYLVASLTAIDRALADGAAKIGRLSGRPREAIQFLKRLQSTIKGMRKAAGPKAQAARTT